MYPFEILTNFRDLGGIPADGGRKIKPRRLLRAGELYNLSAADRQKLVDDFDLKLIVDLRSPMELEERPDDVIPGVDFYHADVTLGARDKVTSEKQMTAVQTCEDMTAHMFVCYEELICHKEATDEYRIIFDKLLKMETGASIFHCFAGKDRTGVTVAVILTALGVSKEDIFLDYMLTNELRKDCNHRFYEAFAKNSGQAIGWDVYEIAMTVRSDYLEYAYKLADEHHGGFDNFVYKAIGLTPEETIRLRNMYLE